MSPLKVFIILAVTAFIISLIFWTKFPKEVPTPRSVVSPKTGEEKLNPVVNESLPSFNVDLEKSIFTDVPFTVQAPFSQWSDPRFQDACEEASVIMAMKWVLGTSFSSKADANDEIIKIIDWQIEKYGSYHDTSAADTTERIFGEFFDYQSAFVKENISATDIISELQKGNLVIAPMNGQALKNPFFTQPGPERHMVLTIGYDATTKEFVTNDPGISQGKNYRYPISIFVEAIRDYPTGDHLPIPSEQAKNIIVITKNRS